MTFGGGCSGSTSTPRLLPRDTPRIGRRLPVLLGPLPADIAFVVAGWNQLPQPVSLAAIGLPGCFVHILADAWTLVTGSGGLATYEFATPNALALVGLRFQHQAFVPDSVAGNALGAVVSDRPKPPSADSSRSERGLAATELHSPPASPEICTVKRQLAVLFSVATAAASALDAATVAS